MPRRHRRARETGGQARQTVRRLEHAPDGFAVVLRRSRARERDLSDGADGGQGRAQLVGGVRREAPKPRDGVLDPGKGLVEDAGQVTQLVLRVLDRQALAEVVDGQSLGLARQPVDGRGARPASQCPPNPAIATAAARPSRMPDRNRCHS
jgi:hypothetical protein